MDNYKILEKVKLKIAISNVKEEDIVMNKNRFNAIKKIGIVACAAFSMTGVVFAATQIINKFGKNSLIKDSSLLPDSTAIERNTKIGGHHE